MLSWYEQQLSRCFRLDGTLVRMNKMLMKREGDEDGRHFRRETWLLPEVNVRSSVSGKPMSSFQGGADASRQSYFRFQSG